MPAGETHLLPHVSRYRPTDDTPWAVMHVVDRVAGNENLLGPAEKDFFRDLMRQISGFTGLPVITWTCLGNHYHILLRIPNEDEAARLRDEIPEEALLERMKTGFSAAYIDETHRRLTQFRRQGKPAIADSILRRLNRQMFDISHFMHMLKRRTSAWYNKQHGREGTLWQGRYKSVLVEDDPEVLLKMAAYIDLNPVRAGLVTHPRAYPWCGYAEAVSGKAEAREGILSIFREAEDAPMPSWDEAVAVYDEWLLPSGPPALSQAEIDAIRAGRGRLSAKQLLHCKVRYFSDGVAIGSREYVESVFERYRHRFGPKRKSGARPLRHGDWGGLCSLRDLQKKVIQGHPETKEPEST